MSYGLYDADLKLYPIPFYNLDLMKLSAYYKRKREIVGLSLDFSPNKYNHFIVRQDFYANQSYPLNLHNIEYGGKAFSGDVYKPMPHEIEIMRPDISLYSKAIPKQTTSQYKNAISTMRRAEHIRLSLDGATVWKDWEKQLRKDIDCFGLILHDYDPAAIDGGIDIISDILQSIHNKSGRRLGMKFPAQIYEPESLIKWLKISPMGTYYSLHYNDLIYHDTALELAEITKHSKAFRQMTIDITEVLQDAYPIEHNINRVYRNIINLRTQRLVFPLIYDNSVFTDNSWKIVMDLIKAYNNHMLLESTYSSNYFSRVAPYETLYSYVKAVSKQYNINNSAISVDSARNVFQFVRENNYALFKDFYEYRGEEVK